jgi:hypothetical protein
VHNILCETDKFGLGKIRYRQERVN